jgi:hypothetical protein
MGQVWNAVMLGCTKPKALAMRDEEGTKVDGKGLLDRWESVVADSHKAEFRKNYWKAGARLVPDNPYVEDGEKVIGFWVAGIEEDDNDHGEEFDTTTSFKEIAKMPRYDRAMARWQTFSDWAKSQGVKLSKPKLMLVQTEVA